ncbi:MAG: hypothetical protein ACH34V_11205 [Flavobacterium sp.]|mgnify:FL=1|uniref:hypothetical protein n=1 Tax=Flavobacterium sp. TaxID=239 RepID=UPI0037A833AE
MKKIFIIILLISATFQTKAQTCDEIMEFVKSKDYGTTYNSYTSTAISKVTFYSIYLDYQFHYFAIVCFKPNEYSYNCNEYIYKVGSNTKLNYSMDYLDSAGKAFWKHIQPYADVLGCSPKFE